MRGPVNDSVLPDNLIPFIGHFGGNVGHFLGHNGIKSDKQPKSHTDPLLFAFYCIFMP